MIIKTTSGNTELKFYLKIQKISFLVLLMSIGLFITEANAQHRSPVTEAGVERAGERELLMKQSQISYYANQTLVAEMKYPKQSLLTFVIDPLRKEQISADKVVEWVRAGNLLVEGHDLSGATLLHQSKWRVKVEIELGAPKNEDYTQSALLFQGVVGMSDIQTELTLYPGFNHIVSLSLNRTPRELASSQTVAPAFSRTHQAVPAPIKPVVYQKAVRDESRRPFLYRNRYWVAGSTALVVGSAAAVIFGSESSPVYLPEPPGRPAFR